VIWGNNCNLNKWLAKQFGPRVSHGGLKTTTTMNVNRRFAGSGLKLAMAMADDETQRKVKWL